MEGSVDCRNNNGCRVSFKNQKMSLHAAALMENSTKPWTISTHLRKIRTFEEHIGFLSGSLISEWFLASYKGFCFEPSLIGKNPAGLSVGENSRPRDLLI